MREEYESVLGYEEERERFSNFVYNWYYLRGEPWLIGERKLREFMNLDGQ